MTDEQRQILDIALFDLSSDSGVRWSREYMAEVAAALRALLDEVAALKAQPDPLAEMWAALADYQPQADRDGHGESWRRMCHERTNASAWNAANAAAEAFAASAAGHAAFAVSRSQSNATKNSVDEAAQLAIAAIRRAKEVQR
jgi:hypothetical protein